MGFAASFLAGALCMGVVCAVRNRARRRRVARRERRSSGSSFLPADHHLAGGSLSAGRPLLADHHQWEATEGTTRPILTVQGTPVPDRTWSPEGEGEAHEERTPPSGWDE
eukprot:1278019-Prymnesium_polylepis.1